MANVDSTQIILDLLKNNWNSGNTDGLLPTFKKIFEQPKTDYDFNKSRDYILGYSPTEESEEAGIGNNSFEDTFTTVIIDVRSMNRTQDSSIDRTDDSHILKVKDEINRILKTNKVNPDPNVSELRSTQQWQEHNDRYRGIFRLVKTLELVEYCREYS